MLIGGMEKADEPNDLDFFDPLGVHSQEIVTQLSAGSTKPTTTTPEDRAATRSAGKETSTQKDRDPHPGKEQGQNGDIAPGHLIPPFVVRQREGLRAVYEPDGPRGTRREFAGRFKRPKRRRE